MFPSCAVLNLADYRSLNAKLSLKFQANIFLTRPSPFINLAYLRFRELAGVVKFSPDTVQPRIHCVNRVSTQGCVLKIFKSRVGFIAVNVIDAAAGRFWTDESASDKVMHITNNSLAAVPKRDNKIAVSRNCRFLFSPRVGTPNSSRRRYFIRPQMLRYRAPIHAHHYTGQNGANYAINSYDTKLAAAYNQLKEA